MAGRRSEPAGVMKLHRLLQRGGGTKAVLASRCGCDPRTIQRWTTLLRQEGAPIQKSKRGLSYSEEYERRLELSKAGVTALMMVRQAVERFGESTIGASVRAELDRMISGLPEAERREANWILDRVVFSGRPPAVIEDQVWENVLDGLRREKMVEIEYPDKNWEIRTRTVEPWGLITRDADWFLYTRERTPGGDQHRTFYLPRIRSAKVTHRSFEVPEGFSLQRYTADGFGGLQKDHASLQDVCLRFPPQHAQRALERPWHSRQTVRTLEDGSVEIRFSVSYTDPVKREVHGWGPEVEMTVG